MSERRVALGWLPAELRKIEREGAETIVSVVRDDVEGEYVIVTETRSEPPVETR